MINGFSLLEVRKLYIDELHYFYKETIYALEKNGTIKEGAYAKVSRVSGDKREETESTIGALRNQMFRALSNKNKK